MPQHNEVIIDSSLHRRCTVRHSVDSKNKNLYR